MVRFGERAVVDMPRDPLDPPAPTEWAERTWLELQQEWASDTRTDLHEAFGEWVRTQVAPEDLCGRLSSASEPVAIRPVRGQTHLYTLQRHRQVPAQPGAVWDCIRPADIWLEFADDERLVRRFLDAQYEERLDGPAASADD